MLNLFKSKKYIGLHAPVNGDIIGSFRYKENRRWDSLSL